MLFMIQKLNLLLHNHYWAVLLEQDGQDKLHFVVESKGLIFENMLRYAEQAKTKCDAAHFKALGTEAGYMMTNNYDNFSRKVMTEGN